jgi:hypothetical protein
MNATQFSKTATGVIATAGSTAHKAIDAYRTGDERLNDALAQRWNKALKQTAPKLTPETRKNAAHAQKVFSGYYTKGIALTADGAAVVVDTLVGAALATTQKATAFAQTARK